MATPSPDGAQDGSVTGVRTGAETDAGTDAGTDAVTDPVTGAGTGDLERRLLDAAPGPMHPRARETLLAALDAGWADPRRLHREGRMARRLLDQAREVVAAGLSVRPPEVAFAPDGPTAVRWMVDGLRYAGRRRGARVVASAVEHSAVLAPGRHAADAAGDPSLFATVPVDRTGHVDLAAWGRALHGSGTVAAVLQHANGEVGTVQPLEAARQMAQAAGAPLAVDAQASLGRLPSPGAAAYDVLAGDATSWGGPGGLGLVVVPERTRWLLPGATDPDAALHGPTRHTPWVPLALAAAEAWQQTEAVRTAEAAEAFDLVARIRAAAAAVADVEVVGDPALRLPHVVTFSALYADGEALVRELDRRGFAVGSGSACTASTLEPSHVLAAMGALTHGNIRVTLPLGAVAADRAAHVDAFCAVLPEVVESVRTELGARRL